MNFKAILLDNFSKVLLGSQAWGDLQAIVKICEDSSLAGQQKRLNAIDKAKDLGIDLLGFMLNLGLELAVAYIRLQ